MRIMIATCSNIHGAMTSTAQPGRRNIHDESKMGWQEWCEENIGWLAGVFLRRIDFGNVVNAAMEEGLFRGVMLTHFAAKHRPWKALGYQAFLFAIWHLVWPIKHFLTGEADTGQALFEAVGLLISTGIGGLVFGYLYYKTDSLWSAFLGHFINNTILNIVFIQTAAGQQSGVEFGLFLAIWLLGYLALIPLINWLAKKYSLPAFSAWKSEKSA